MLKTGRLDPLKSKLRAIELAPPPLPWRKVATLAIGGLNSVGFDRNSELLMVLSSQGRGVIDCRSGDKVARDYNEYYANGYLEADGIGPLYGNTIRIFLLSAGGLPAYTHDGWSVEFATLDWPVKDIFLVEPNSFLLASLYGKPEKFTKIGTEYEPVMCGFSYSGNSLVIATSSDVAIFSRT
ncbi:MAG: hypothetical protein LBE21_05610 [Pseudomonadales bacterium]|nr:hypothetical protein [Pseudomonadales bacterium]